MVSSEKKKFTDRLGAFTSATLISRILGYVRDALVAATFGGGWVTDAFYAAFRVPNLLRRFLGEGAMTAAFVPVFTDVENEQGKEEATRFFQSLLSGLILVLMVLVVLGILFAPTIAQVVAWGFGRTPAKMELTIELIRVIFPFLLVISLAALLTALLNSTGRFFIPAIAPAGLSVAMIGFILLFSKGMISPIHGLAIAVVVGGGLHFVLQIPQAAKQGYPLKLSKRFHIPETKTFFILLVPTIIGLCADQINAFVDQFCASFLRDGSVTALYNSNRVMQLPLALFGIAVSSVALPALSKSASNKNEEEYKDLLGFSLRIANYILIPSMVGLMVLGVPIIQLLFEHGRFTSEYTQLTFMALFPYALGLPAYSAIRILATAFYAKKNTKTPVRVALWAMGLHVVLNFLLMWKLQVAGLALSTAISAWFQAIILFFLIRRRVGSFGGWAIVKSTLISIVLGTSMGALCLFGDIFLAPVLSVYFRVPVLIGGGIAFYFGLSKLIRIKEFDTLMQTVLRRKIQS